MLIKLSSFVILFVAFSTLFASIVSDSGFKCYSGRGDTVKEIICENCRVKSECMCMKVPDYQGGTARGCWSNPFNALKPGCTFSQYQGLQMEMCFCDTELCNSAKMKSSSIGVTAMLSIIISIVGRYFL